MTTKTTGAEFKRYYTDPVAWPEGWWHDDTYITVDGVDYSENDLTTMPDEAVVKIESGYVVCGDSGDTMSMDAHFRKWRKAQNTTVLMVTVDNDKLEAVKEAIKAAGGKVSKS